MSDLILRLPWVNRRRPFIGLHISPFPSYRSRGGRSRRYYHCGVIWGRQFMPTTQPASSVWFDVYVPEWRRA